MNITEYTTKYDTTGQFEVLKNSWKQVEYAESLKIELSGKSGKLNSVIIAGMGGSAISGDLVKNFVRDEIKIPFFVNRNYNLPSFADKNTMIIISSYSGNTEESLSVLKEALKKKCIIVCITTGGEVKKISDEQGISCIPLIPGMQPRYALGQSFFVLLKVLENYGIINGQSDSIQIIKELWKEKGEEYSLDENIAINYARQLIGFIPVIYSAADYTDAAGYRFKCQLNENSKQHAFHNVYPELNHNEIVGWESFNQRDLRVKVINLIDRDYPAQIRKRFRITSGLISGRETDIINLESTQDNFKIRLFDLIYLTDWITYYLAVLRGFDPVEIDYINLLKKQLS